MYYKTLQMSNSKTNLDIYRSVYITPENTDEFEAKTFSDVFRLCNMAYNNFKEINRIDLNDNERKIYDVLIKYVNKQNGFAIGKSVLSVRAGRHNSNSYFNPWGVNLEWEIYPNISMDKFLEDDEIITTKNEFFDYEFITSSMKFYWPTDDIDNIRNDIDSIEKGEYESKNDGSEKGIRLDSINNIFNLKPENFEVLYENPYKYFQDKCWIVAKNRMR